MVVALWWELIFADRDVHHLVHDFAPGVHLLSPAPSESPAPGVCTPTSMSVTLIFSRNFRNCSCGFSTIPGPFAPPRGKGHQRHTIRPLCATCTTWTADLRPRSLMSPLRLLRRLRHTISFFARPENQTWETAELCSTNAPLPCQSLDPCLSGTGAELL